MHGCYNSSIYEIACCIGGCLTCEWSIDGCGDLRRQDAVENPGAPLLVEVIKLVEHFNRSLIDVEVGVELNTALKRRVRRLYTVFGLANQSGVQSNVRLHRRS